MTETDTLTIRAPESFTLFDRQITFFINQLSQPRLHQKLRTFEKKKNIQINEQNKNQKKKIGAANKFCFTRENKVWDVEGEIGMMVMNQVINL